MSSVDARRAPPSGRPRASLKPPSDRENRPLRYIPLSPAVVAAATVCGVVAYALGASQCARVLAPFLKPSTPDLHGLLVTGILLMIVPFVLFAMPFLFPRTSGRPAAICGLVGLCLLSFLWGLWVSGPAAAASRGRYIQGVFDNFMDLMMLSQFAVTTLGSLGLTLVFSPAMQRTRLTVAILATSVLGSALYCYCYVNLSL